MDSEDEDHDQQPAASSDGLAYVVDREPHLKDLRFYNYLKILATLLEV